EPLSIGNRETKDGVIPLLTESNQLEDLVGLSHRGRGLQPAGRLAEERAHRGVLPNRHRGERPDDLKGAADPQAGPLIWGHPPDRRLLPADVACLRMDHAAHAVEESGLAGAVR